MIQRCSMMLLAFVFSSSALAAAPLPDLGADWIGGKLTETEFWQKAKADRGDLPWSEAERAYLDDLYANRKEAGSTLLCERWEEASCGAIAKKEAPVWTAIPLEKQPAPADSNGWWKNPWFWGGAALLIGGGLAASGKRVRFKSSMN